MRLYPVVLSGGSGTRLWPWSREHHPKQLLSFGEGPTLLQQTATRLDGCGLVLQPLIVVCNEEYRFLVAEQLREIGKEDSRILLEPCGRNTAPALTLAALSICEVEDDALMMVMAADHVITDVAAFHKAVGQAAAIADSGLLATFGIVPTRPETGYGYIRRGEGHAVEAFVEKPDAETAKHYLKSGRYLWNSGMFLMRVSAWLDEVSRCRPDVLEACRIAYAAAIADNDFVRVDKSAFSACPSESIDYAVMEKTQRAAVVPLDAGWSDVGAWSALWDVHPRDPNGNVIEGDVVTHNTKDTILFSQSRLLAAVGVQNLIVVETADAVLVAHRDHAQDVKEIVARLKQAQREEIKSHRRAYRPWGYYEGVDTGPRFQVKRICVKPGAALSLQMHHHRAEHWVVVKGTARVTRGDDVFIVTENESTFIPLGTKHRLENPGSIPLEMIEVQSGSYLGEDDIVRFEDRYNRSRNL